MSGFNWDLDRKLAVAKYVWKEERRLLIVALVVLVLVSFIVLPVGRLQGHTDWWTFAEPISGVLTLVLAVVIWWQQIEDRWLASLPKELTASFYFGDQLVMRCERAYLASEADIRAWAQQLGSQMATREGDERPAQLAFLPDILQDIPIVELQDGRYVKSYAVRFNLRKIPDGLKESVERGQHVVCKRPSYANVLE